MQKNLHVARVMLHAMSILLHGIPPRRVLPAEVFQPAQKQREGTPPLLHYFQEKCQAMKKKFPTLENNFSRHGKIFSSVGKKFSSVAVFSENCARQTMRGGGRTQQGG